MSSSTSHSGDRQGFDQPARENAPADRLDTTCLWKPTADTVDLSDQHDSVPQPHSPHTDFLRQVRPFCDLPESVTNTIALCMTERQFAVGERLLQQGGTPDQLVVLTEGEVEIRLADVAQQQHLIARDGPGSVLGEMGLLTNRPSNASVVAVTPVRALVLARADFERLSRQFPTLGVGFAHVIATRLGREEIDVFYDKTIRGYRIQRRLGSGAMSVVYEAQSTRTGERFALKMMKHPLAYSHEAVQRFHQEAQVLTGLHCPNIVAIHECFEACGTFFIAMELCDGPTLRSLLEAAAPLPIDAVRAVLGQLAGALAHAHGQNVVHRDVKPGNVMILRDGTLKLSDFGLAKTRLGDSLTLHGEVLGTPRYMPPEQLVGSPVDYRADVYAFGCVAFELLTGRPMFDEPETLGLLRQQLQWSCDATLDELRRQRPDADEPLQRLLRESLAIDPRHRILRLPEIAAWAAPIDAALIEKVLA